MRLHTLAVAVAATCLLASCSTKSPEPQSPEPAAPPTTSSVHGSLAECLSKHGVPAAVGPAVAAPPGVDANTWRNAMKDCSPLGPGPAN
ncbi:hypothetical protein [Mycobacterium sp. AT1]|uniref:hypothetical protein n=1 Tax=Mycobacterium sp. AT1 TaxID=1961706 RepID=UPI0009AD4D89|nr:hypothetical protein [Mycobacterium sp. AT1]OPX09208.1 hypothetical protein B1790_16290 [Mycobacterium sp. AT1]